MTRRMFFAAALVLVLIPVAAQAAESVGQIAGMVIDGEGKGVADTHVVLYDHDGIPLVEETFHTLTDVALAGDLKDPRLATCKTDRNGHFLFDAVPFGKYRLVAQSWSDDTVADNLLETLVTEIHLRGTADNVTASAKPPTIVIRPLGDGVLRIDDNLNKDGALVALSVSATRVDPALRFIGWGGPFARGAIGFTRKKAGPLVVRGLPDGAVHVAVCGFFADDMSGWGVGEAVVTPEEPVDLRVPVLSTWAGNHEPPERLRPLFGELKSIGPGRSLLQVFQQAGIAFPPSSGGLQGVWLRDQVIAKNLDLRIALPSGREATFADIMAAVHYIQLEQLREREKTVGQTVPNARRE